MPTEGRPAATGPSRAVVFLAVCALGVSSIVTQLTLMRELLTVFAGNEMILGIILGCWLLLTGLGSALGRTTERLKRPLRVLILAQLAVAVVPIAQVFVIRACRDMVFPRGVMLGPSDALLSCLVLLTPYCLVTGYLLTLAARLLGTGRSAAGIGWAYFLDVLGDVAGGLLFTFVLVVLLNHFHTLYVPAILNVLCAILLAVRCRSRFLVAAGAVVAAVFATVALAVDLDTASTDLQYAGRKVVFSGSGRYGRLVVTESAGQHDFISGGVPLFSTHQIERAEETVHYAMCQRPHAPRVLLVAGGVSGTVREILKYGPQRIDYVELDPMIVTAARRFLPDRLADPRVHVIHDDGRRWVKRTLHRYDVVIVDVPDPVSSQLNRFYTREFFREVRAVLATDGVLCFSLGGPENYLSEELALLLGSAHQTVAEVFNNVQPIPGGRVFFLASDGPITRPDELADRIAESGVRTDYVNHHYLDGHLTAERLDQLGRAIATDAPANRDLSPILYYYSLRRWLTRFDVPLGVLAGGLVVCTALYLTRIRPVTLAIFTTGFAAAALEMVLILAFQAFYGYVYEKLALIMTAFMAGLAAGSLTANKLLPILRRAHLARLQLSVAIFAGALPVLLMAIGGAPGGAIGDFCRHAVIPLLTFILAALVGAEFPLAGAADFRTLTGTAASLYTADLTGSFLGAILVSALLIPLVGVVWVCVIVAGLNVLSALVLMRTAEA